MKNEFKRIHHVIFVAVFAYSVFFKLTLAIGQPNYTVGTSGYGNNKAYVFSPFKFEFDNAEEQFKAYVGSDDGDSSGQNYDVAIFFNGPPPLLPTCTVPKYDEILSNSLGEFALLLHCGHGWHGGLAIEPFDTGAPGSTAAMQRGYELVAQGYGGEIYLGHTSSNIWSIGVYAAFIRNRGQLQSGLAYLNTCESGHLVDDFYAAGARVAVGQRDSAFYSSEARERTQLCFRRMDGHEGIGKRTVDSALQSPPHYMDSLMVSGNQNTTLSPVVTDVSGPPLLFPGDTITLTLDTKCDPDFVPPEIDCYPCQLESVTWREDSLAIIAVMGSPPPPGTDECEFTLDWTTVKSARNDARLDGNTCPPGGQSGVGPSNDDYVWTMDVISCDCGDQYGTDPNAVGDINCDGTTDPTAYSFWSNSRISNKMPGVISRYVPLILVTSTVTTA